MLGILTLLMPLLSSVIGKVIPDAGQAAAANLELQKALLENQADLDKAVAEAAKAQMEINLAEAQSPSAFRGNWRPMIGWVCAVACGYSFLLQPLLAWIAGIASALAAAAIPAPPALDMGTLMTLLGGMLGLGTLRTAEKVKGVDTPAPKGRAR